MSQFSPDPTTPLLGRSGWNRVAFRAPRDEVIAVVPAFPPTPPRRGKARHPVVDARRRRGGGDFAQGDRLPGGPVRAGPQDPPDAGGRGRPRLLGHGDRRADGRRAGDAHAPGTVLEFRKSGHMASLFEGS